MTDRPAIPELIRTSKVIAIGRNVPAEDVPRVAEALVAGDVHVIELTLNEPEAAALESIAALARVADDLGVLVGAGTVLSIAAAQRAVDAGARFIVSPHTDCGLVGWCAADGVPAFPGALSATEILAAWTAGASAVKLFRPQRGHRLHQAARRALPVDPARTDGRRLCRHGRRLDRGRRRGRRDGQLAHR
jgi:2-dehydro-3-deoxyphosphogluconate aldolase/(4S)-4-hydroxy-2-oxoglutarate aldolase